MPWADAKLVAELEGALPASCSGWEQHSCSTCTSGFLCPAAVAGVVLSKVSRKPVPSSSGFSACSNTQCFCSLLFHPYTGRRPPLRASSGSSSSLHFFCHWDQLPPEFTENLLIPEKPTALVVGPAANWKLSVSIESHWVYLLTSKKTFWVFGLCFIYRFEVCGALYFLTRCDSHSWMTFISSCARSHAAPCFVSLKAFAARVFTFLCAVAVNIVSLGTFCSKAGAHANSTVAGFKSTAFVTPGTERNCVALCPCGILC